MPFTTTTAPAMGRRGGSRATRAQRRALAMGRRARRGSGYVPPDLPAVLASLRLARAITARDRTLRTLARHMGVTHDTVRRWFRGVAYPRPGPVAVLRGWLSCQDPPDD